MSHLGSGGLRHGILAATEKALRDAAYEIERSAKRDAPVSGTGKNRNPYAKGTPGTLRRSIHAKKVTPTAWLIGVHDGPARAYARMRDLGGTIRPVRAKRLFWISADGQGHSAQIVTQTGTKYLPGNFERVKNEMPIRVMAALRAGMRK